MASTVEVRARKVQEALFERYDQLNALWDKAEERITAFHIPQSVCYEYETVYQFDPQFGDQPVFGLCLGLQKVKGKWRICHGTYQYNWPEEELGWKPITECSAEVRASAAAHLPEFREKVISSAEKFVPVVDEAILRLRGFVNEDIEKLLAERAKLNGRAS